jgi:nitrogen fixation NifU-like protein
MQLESLYQDIILDHYKHPRGRGTIDAPEGESHQINPTCGDEVTVQVALDAAGTLRIGYEGQGCSISQASASVMSELLVGHSPAQAEAARVAFLELMHSQGAGEPDEGVLGDGVAFVGVSKYPARIKCALLPWVALQDAEAKAGIDVNDAPTEREAQNQEGPTA